MTPAKARQLGRIVWTVSGILILAILGVLTGYSAYRHNSGVATAWLFFFDLVLLGGIIYGLRPQKRR